MKLAVISDIHGILPAFEAVVDDLERWRPEVVVVNGDLANRGPSSRECLELLGERLPEASCTRGNHDNLVLDAADSPLSPEDPEFEIRRMSHWTALQMGTQVETMRAWPDHLEWHDPQWGTVHITHGSRISDRHGVSARTPDADMPERVGEGADLFICSHTHEPMIRRWHRTLVVNTGAVGQPFDGDPRAAYGRFTFAGGHWHAEIARVPFDRERALRDFYETGFVEGAGPLARVVYREIEECRGRLLDWMRTYADAVKAGEIDIAVAVDEYLASLKD